jgi:hypothetical protein
MLLWYLPLRDSDKASEARLRSEKIVEAIFAGPIVDLISDREESPSIVEEEAELCLLDESPGE